MSLQDKILKRKLKKKEKQKLKVIEERKTTHDSDETDESENVEQVHGLKRKLEDEDCEEEPLQSNVEGKKKKKKSKDLFQLFSLKEHPLPSLFPEKAKPEAFENSVDRTEVKTKDDPASAKDQRNFDSL